MNWVPSPENSSPRHPNQPLLSKVVKALLVILSSSDFIIRAV